jgi:hypothetical protein
MFALRDSIIAGLFLSIAGTVASCLIPELTIIGGIWGIPVLGFALLVAVIFRVGVYYDPRVEQSPDAREYAGYVAGSFLGYLAVFSCLEMMFQKGQHIAAILGTILGILVMLSLIVLTDYVWVTNQTPEYPTICQIRRFFFLNSSTLLVIAYFTSQEGMVNVMKPFVVFFAYTNCVYFAAVYCGIFRDRAIFQSNGTITERLREWIRSKTQPGELLTTVKTLLIAAFFGWLFIEAFSEIPARFSLVSKGIFAALTTVSFYCATLYDPRKPPETSKLVRRVLALSVFFAIESYFDWYVQNKSHSHFVVVVNMILLRFLLSFWLMTGEMSPEIFHQKLLLIAFHLGMYTISAVLFLVLNMANMSFELQTVALTICKTWYYYNTIYVIAVISGMYRDDVRQAPPAQVPPAQAPPAQVQPEVRVELSQLSQNLEQSSIELQRLPFNRRQSVESFTENV